MLQLILLQIKLYSFENINIGLHDLYTFNTYVKFGCYLLCDL